jgi:hypothetical protein
MLLGKEMRKIIREREKKRDFLLLKIAGGYTLQFCI